MESRGLQQQDRVSVLLYISAWIPDIRLLDIRPPEVRPRKKRQHEDLPLDGDSAPSPSAQFHTERHKSTLLLRIPRICRFRWGWTSSGQISRVNLGAPHKSDTPRIAISRRPAASPLLSVSFISVTYVSHFTARRYAQARSLLLASVRPSVCLSVYLSRSCIVSRRLLSYREISFSAR